jgi:hypothetical protein
MFTIAKRVIHATLLLALTLPINGAVSSSIAAESDRIAIGDERVVGILGPAGSVGCAGALLAPRIVYTAAHCISRRPKGEMNANTKGVPIVSGIIPENLEDLYITLPGIKVENNTSLKIRAIAQFASPKYVDSSYDCVKDKSKSCHPSLYDFAVLVLEKPYPVNNYRIATKDEVKNLVDAQANVFGIGYGKKKFGGDQSEPGLFYANLRSVENSLNETAKLNDLNNVVMHIQIKCSNQAAPCSGLISGSPLWLDRGGESIYIGAASATMGNYPGSDPSDPLWKNSFWSLNSGGEYYTAQAFPDVIERANVFLAQQVEKEESELLALKIKKDVEERAVAEAKAAEELKNKLDAEAKALSEKVEAEKKMAPKNSAQKKLSITCVKGKLTKKVTAISPKCPSGYKKR